MEITMQLPQDGTLSCIFIGEADKYEGKPLIVEMVDTSEKLDSFLELIDPRIKAGLVTLEKAKIKFYRYEP
jgi:PII-like signaling protein